jgi:proteasome lid subunit RPN8/RPN11
VTLLFKRSAMDAAAAHCEEGYPHEVAGLLAGDRAAWRVDAVIPFVNENDENPARRYTVTAPAMMRAQRRIRELGLEEVGYYHSHPEHPAQYSEEDRDKAWPNMAYPIFSVLAGKVEDIRAWKLRDDRSAMDEEAIEPIED